MTTKDPQPPTVSSSPPVGEELPVLEIAQDDDGRLIGRYKNGFAQNMGAGWFEYVPASRLAQAEERVRVLTSNLEDADDELKKGDVAFAELNRRVAELERLGAIKDGMYDGKKDQVRHAQAREQRLLTAFEELVKELEHHAKVIGWCGPAARHGAEAYARAAEWAQAALAKAKGEKG